MSPGRLRAADPAMLVLKSVCRNKVDEKEAAGYVAGMSPEIRRSFFRDVRCRNLDSSLVSRGGNVKLWMKYGFLEPEGSCGGILILWDSRVWKGIFVEKGQYSLTYRFVAVQKSFSWCLTGVYAPHTRIEKNDAALLANELVDSKMKQKTPGIYSGGVGLLAANLGCQVGTLPTKYLGMPLGAKNKAQDIWSEVLERCDRRIKVDNGFKASFWDDWWIEQNNLKTLFPDLYILSLQKQATERQIWMENGWKLNFGRALNDWEVDRAIKLLHCLNFFEGIVDVPDKQEAENNEQLFQHCEITANLWQMFFDMLGVIWVMPRTTLELLKNWKTGQERFRTLTSSYYRGAQGIIMVYDVTRRDTFTNLSDIWAKEIDLYSTNQDCIKMLVGNKVDKESDRVVSKKEGIDFAREYGCLFIECSAKTRVNVEQCFEELVLKGADIIFLVVKSIRTLEILSLAEQQILDTPSLLAEGSAGVRKNIFKQKPPETDASTSGCC
ncbi:Ras-related protein RABC2a [Capsicum annuum]|nr:Ras-related protein RABC2a [Capsicum annuum]